MVCDGKRSASPGELGLTGELRYVGHPDRRIAEARKFGLEPVLGPMSGDPVDGLSPRQTIKQALKGDQA